MKESAKFDQELREVHERMRETEMRMRMRDQGGEDGGHAGGGQLPRYADLVKEGGGQTRCEAREVREGRRSGEGR